MGRLTEKEASGRWQVKGIQWDQLKVGKIITEKTGQKLYICLCKLRDYEDFGMSPDQLERWKYELEDMAQHVCDDICHYRREITGQEELDAACEGCPVSACLGRLMELEDL